MFNFTVSPVTLNSQTLKIGSEQMPYFRTKEFSDIIFENEKLIKKILNASNESKVCFITGSGTASMEAAVINTFSESDKILLIDAGDFSFGHRFAEILTIHNIPFETLKPQFGCSITEKELSDYNDKGFTGFIVNMHETSVGVLYDMKIISDFCKRNNLILMIDAISSFLCDNIDMTEMNIDVLITTSSKALQCPPAISIIVLSERALERVYNNNPKSLYFDLKTYLKNAERGQTPFTPAISVLCQINQRLKDIEANGGIKKEIERVKDLAEYFRTKLKELNLNFRIVSNSLSNCVTPLECKEPHKVFEYLKEKDIFIQPNGGEIGNKLFRVGHIGNINKNDIDILLNALKEYDKSRNLRNI